MEIKSYLYKNRDLFARLLLICQKTKELFSDIKEFYSKVSFKVSLWDFDTLEFSITQHPFYFPPLRDISLESINCFIALLTDTKDTLSFYEKFFWVIDGFSFIRLIILYSKVSFKVSLRAFDTLEILTTCSLTWPPAWPLVCPSSVTLLVTLLLAHICLICCYIGHFISHLIKMIC